MVSLIFYMGLIFVAGIGIILISLCSLASKALDPAEFLGDDLSGTEEVYGDCRQRLAALMTATLRKKVVT